MNYIEQRQFINFFQSILFHYDQMAYPLMHSCIRANILTQNDVINVSLPFCYVAMEGNIFFIILSVTEHLLSY